MWTAVRLLLTTTLRPCSAPPSHLRPLPCRCPAARSPPPCRRTISNRPSTMAARDRTEPASPRQQRPLADRTSPKREPRGEKGMLADRTSPKREPRDERGMPAEALGNSRNSPKRKTPPTGSENGGEAFGGAAQRLASPGRDRRGTSAAAELMAAISRTGAQRNADQSAQQSNKQNVPANNNQQNAPQRKPEVSGEEMLQKVRVWEPVSHQSPAQGNIGPGREFTMVSYNVLSQHLYDVHPELYEGAPPADTAWQVRGPRLWAQLVSLRADIVCLQEVEERDIETFWRPRCNQEGFNILYKKRTGADKLDGCAVLYRESVFSLGELATVEYHQDCRALDRDNVGIVARLRIAGGGGDLVVACTHLLYNPRRHDVKLAQMALLLAEVERLAWCGRQRSYLPVLLAGDLNLEPHSPVYEFLCRGLLEYYGLSRKQLTPFSNGEQLVAALLPPQLGVNAYCRHSAVQIRRTERLYGPPGEVETEAERRRAERQLLAVRHSERRHPLPQLPLQELAQEGADCYLAHELRLQSVYGHDARRQKYKEVTTKQRQWVTVDYIFQSVPPPGCARLELTSRLALPSAAVCERLLPYPSAALPSDHLPLAARFRLVPPGDPRWSGHRS